MEELWDPRCNGLLIHTHQQVLHVEVATDAIEGGIVGEALERVLLKRQNSALHAMLRLAHDDDCVAERLAAPASLPVG